MGLQDHFRRPRVLRAEVFWCQRHQPLAFIYMISHGSSLSRECQYMSCNYRRNTHGVTRILNACWFNHDLSTHNKFVYYVYKWLVLLCQKHRRWCLCVFWSKYLWTNMKFMMANKLYVQFTFYICFSHWSVRTRGKICHQICDSREHFFFFCSWGECCLFGCILAVEVELAFHFCLQCHTCFWTLWSELTVSSLGSEGVSGLESVWRCAPPGLNSEWQLIGLKEGA